MYNTVICYNTGRCTFPAQADLSLYAYQCQYNVNRRNTCYQ
jgi:hypothetical protein